MRWCLIALLTLSLMACGTSQSTVFDWQKKPASARVELENSATPRLAEPSPSTDPAHITPLPVEMPDQATYLPEGMELVVPWEGTFDISNGYGLESSSWTHQTISNQHSANDFYALDIGMPIGTPVYAMADGQIVTSGRRNDSYGNYVCIDHGGGITSIYAHLDSRTYDVMHGEPEVHVTAGQRIGVSGKTGTSAPHLHIAVHTDSYRSRSGADVGGLATVPEPLGGYYNIQVGTELTGGQ